MKEKPEDLKHPDLPERKLKPPGNFDKFLDSFGIGKRWEKMAAYLEQEENIERIEAERDARDKLFEEMIQAGAEVNKGNEYAEQVFLDNIKNTAKKNELDIDENEVNESVEVHKEEAKANSEEFSVALHQAHPDEKFVRAMEEQASEWQSDAQEKEVEEAMESEAEKWGGKGSYEVAQGDISEAGKGLYELDEEGETGKDTYELAGKEPIDEEAAKLYEKPEQEEEEVPLALAETQESKIELPALDMDEKEKPRVNREKMMKEIDNALYLNDIVKVVKKWGGVTNEKKGEFYSPKEIEKEIDNAVVNPGKKGRFSGITRAMGLRGKVKEIILSAEADKEAVRAEDEMEGAIKKFSEEEKARMKAKGAAEAPVGIPIEFGEEEIEPTVPEIAALDTEVDDVKKEEVQDPENVAALQRLRESQKAQIEGKQAEYEASIKKEYESMVKKEAQALIGDLESAGLLLRSADDYMKKLFTESGEVDERTLMNIVDSAVKKLDPSGKGEFSDPSLFERLSKFAKDSAGIELLYPKYGTSITGAKLENLQIVKAGIFPGMKKGDLVKVVRVGFRRGGKVERRAEVQISD